jgi:hypothetical protein
VDGDNADLVLPSDWNASHIGTLESTRIDSGSSASGLALISDGSGSTLWGEAGSPNAVIGPASAIDGHLVVFDGVSGKLVRDGGTKDIAFSLDVPPVSPHAKDDEFSGSALDVKWTNPATSTRTLTLTVSNGWLRFEPSEAGSASTGVRGGFGIRQTAPTGSFSISAKIVNTGHVGDDGRVGIFVATGSATAHGSIVGSLRGFARIANYDGFTYSETADWGAYDGTDVYSTPEWPSIVWLKMVWDSATSILTCYYTADGCVWTYLNARTAQVQPTAIGLAIWGNSANIYADHVLMCDWFRVTEP